MNRNQANVSKKMPSALAAVAVCAVLVAALTGCGLRRNQQPPAVPTNAPVQQNQPQATEPAAAPTGAAQPDAVQPDATQPTAVPPTEVIAPTTAPDESIEIDAQADEIEALLDQLDRENQKADPLDDVPE